MRRSSREVGTSESRWATAACTCWSCSTGPTLAFKDVALQLLGRMLDQR
jgi:threonine synthase